VTWLPFDDFAASSRREGTRTVVRLDGDLDLFTDARARAEIAAAMATDGNELVLDLRGLTLLAACGVSVLVDALEAARWEGRRLRLVPAPGHVQRTLALCRIEDRFETVEPGEEPERLSWW
jgi:anti-sigma B factor antagonist